MKITLKFFRVRVCARLAPVILICCWYLAARTADGAEPSKLDNGNLSDHAVLTPQIGHNAIINSASFSPDGTLIVSSSGDRTAKVWEASTGTLLHTLTGHSSEISFAAFSPDGKRIVTASSDQTANVWDVATGTLLRSLVGHHYIVNCASFSPNGRQIVTASSDHTAKVWATFTGQLLHTLIGHDGTVTSASFSHNGKLIVTSSSDDTVKIWDSATGTLLRTATGHAAGINSAAFSPDDRLILTASLDGTARIWDVSTHRLVRTFYEFGKAVFSAAFSPNGRQIILASMDKSARVYDARTGALIQTLAGHRSSVSSAVFSPNGEQVVTASLDTTAKIWDVRTGRPLMTLTGYAHAVNSAYFSPDARQIVTANSDNTAKVWDVPSGTLLRTLAGHSGPVLFAAFSPDGKRIVTASWDRTAKVWDAARGALLHTLKGHDDLIQSMSVSPDSKQILTVSADETAKTWDTATGTLLHTLESPDSAITLANFSPDSKEIVTTTSDNALEVWDAATGKLLRTLVGHKASIESASFSPDGTQIVTASADKTAKIWNSMTGVLTRTLIGHHREVKFAVFTPDSRWIVTTSMDGDAIIWDSESGKPLYTLEGHTRPVNSAVFSPNGKLVVTTSPDATAKVWDIQTGTLLHTLGDDGVFISSVSFSPNGMQIVSTSWDNTTRIWDTTTGKELGTLISFDDGRWSVTDPKGRFDASDDGDVPGLHWVVRNEPIALSQLRDRYYEPGLLAKVMGFDLLPLRDVVTFDHIKLYPLLAAKEELGGSPNRLRVRLTERDGGGIGRVAAYVNDILYREDVRPADSRKPGMAKLDFVVDLSGSPTLRPGGLAKNEIRLVAYNGEGWLPSRGLDFRTARSVNLLATPPGELSLKQRRLFAIIAGTSNYASSRLHLTYPARDAAAFVKALRLGVNGDPLIDKSHPADITLLASGPGTPAGTQAPTKANITAAFGRIVSQKPTPDDILVIYLSGHGVAIPLDGSTYCYLTQNANSADLSAFANDPSLRAATTLTSNELAAMMGKIGASYRVVILDTCAAGAAAKMFMDKRAVSGDQIRAMKRFQDAEGCHVLMGCAADKESYEASQYGQGLLTYALLEGMKGAALRAKSWIDVRTLFDYAEETVPKIAGDIGGIQHPRYQKPAGSFDIGKLTEADRSHISLSVARPQLLRPHMGNKALDGVDDLNLAERLSTCFSDADALANPDESGDGVSRVKDSFVYVEADQLTGAVQPVGLYEENGDSVTVTFTLVRDNKPIGERQTVIGRKASEAEIKNLAENVADAVEKSLGNEH